MHELTEEQAKMLEYAFEHGDFASKEEALTHALGLLIQENPEDFREETPEEKAEMLRRLEALEKGEAVIHTFESVEDLAAAIARRREHLNAGTIKA